MFLSFRCGAAVKSQSISLKRPLRVANELRPGSCTLDRVASPKKPVTPVSAEAAVLLHNLIDLAGCLDA